MEQHRVLHACLGCSLPPILLVQPSALHSPLFALTSSLCVDRGFSLELRP